MSTKIILARIIHGELCQNILALKILLTAYSQRRTNFSVCSIMFSSGITWSQIGLVNSPTTTKQRNKSIVTWHLKGASICLFVSLCYEDVSKSDNVHRTTNILGWKRFGRTQPWPNWDSPGFAQMSWEKSTKIFMYVFREPKTAFLESTSRISLLD
jgi:hypothetical protein